MKDEEYNFIYEDVLSIIRSKNKIYDLEHFSSISFSGGSDSMLVSCLIDEAIPNNNIPRLYMNTGIEHRFMREFVLDLAKNDSRFIILTPKVNIPRMLKKEGYPFKSKQHSQNYGVYFRNKFKINNIVQDIEKEPSLVFDYDFIHNLDRGVKSVIKYIFGTREREKECCTSIKIVPKVLEYQFKGDIPIFISDKCCLRMKEQPLDNWNKEHNKSIAIIGLRSDEGGRRAINKKCMSFSKKQITFKPLMHITNEFKEEYFKRNNIKLCKLYYSPYDFKRTGCVGCPFNKDLQKDLEVLYKLLPNEYKQCLHIWKPVYDEYIRIGYRLKYYPHEVGVQFNIYDYLGENQK